jgi:hypothetical protein
MKGVIESFELLQGIPLAHWGIVGGPDDLSQFGFPCFLKVDLGEHKTEKGAVLKCNDLEGARANLLKLHKNFPKERIIVQESVDGIEMIVGMKEDKVFGRLLVLGFGGIFAEVRRDVSFRALPVSRKDIIEMFKDLEGIGVFNSRSKKYDLDKFYTLVEKVAYLGDKKKVVEMDLNPVVVGEKRSVVVDARFC